MKTTAKIMRRRAVCGTIRKERKPKTKTEQYHERHAGAECYPRGHGSLDELERRLATI